MVGDGASEGLWGCSIVGAAEVVHPWGAGGGASLLEGCRRRLPTRRALAVALVAARQRDYGGGAVGAVGGGRWAVAAHPWVGGGKLAMLGCRRRRLGNNWTTNLTVMEARQRQ